MSTHPHAQSAARPGFSRPGTRWWAPAASRRSRAGAGANRACPWRTCCPPLTFHVMQGAGTLAEHFSHLFDDSLADSSWADRRARVAVGDLCRVDAARLAAQGDPAAPRRVLARVAGGRARWHAVQPDQHAADHRDARRKRGRGAGRAAFAKITTAVLLEVGLHNPLAAAIGRHGESEWALAQRLLAQLPKRALLLGDRLYGVAAFVVHARAACARVGSHFLLRASRSTKPRLIKRLPDGTRLVADRACARGHQPDPHSRVARGARDSRPRRPAGASHARAAPVDQSGRSAHGARARTRAALRPALGTRAVFPRGETAGAQDRPSCRVTRVETAAQEIAALILVSALLAAERRRAAGGQLPGPCA